MNRKEAARVLEYHLKNEPTYIGLDDALRMSIAALNEVGIPTTQLDENGLVPCGCGGKAKLYHRHSTILPKQILWVVQCVKFGKCGISTLDCIRKQNAIALWNLAMSGQIAEQKPVKTRNETPPKPGVTVQVSDNPGCKL